MSQQFTNGKNNWQDPVQPEKKSSAPKIVSIIALVFSSIALISGAVSPLFLANPSGSVHLTNQAVLEISGFIVSSLFGFSFSLIGVVLGMIGAIMALTKKKSEIIWMPVLAIILGLAASFITYLGLPV